MIGQCHKSYLYRTLNELRKDISDFNEDFIKSHNDESDEVYFPEVDFLIS